MKKNVMLVVALLISTITFAQMRQRNTQANGMHQADKMKTVLSLSDEQYTLVKAVNEKYADKSKQLRQNGSDDREQFRKLREDRRSEINAVLTKEQQQTWKEHQAKQRAGRKSEPGKRNTERMDKMKTSLGLSDDQVNKLHDINRKFMVQRKTVMDDASVSQEDKKTRMKALRSEHDTAVKSILTAEQYNKWAAERKQRGGKKKQPR